MQQMIELAKILDQAEISHLSSEHNRKNKTDALIIPLFHWKGELAGIVIDCDPGDMNDVYVTGHLPAAVTGDLQESELLQTVNADNANIPGIQMFVKDGSVYMRKTVDTTHGLLPDVVINAVYDVSDAMNRYKKNARKRGNFPVESPTYKEADLPT